MTPTKGRRGGEGAGSIEEERRRWLARLDEFRLPHDWQECKAIEENKREIWRRASRVREEKERSKEGAIPPGRGSHVKKDREEQKDREELCQIEIKSQTNDMVPGTLF
jgi:hypothetical protein